MDIFVVNNDGPGILLRNEEGNKNNWLNIALKGIESNSQAIGAKLRLTVGNFSQIKQVGFQGTYCSQNSLIQHFGLGSLIRVDKLEIIWPSGSRQQFNNLTFNQSIIITKGDSEPHRQDL